jgi:hypothetical protein
MIRIPNQYKPFQFTKGVYYQEITASAHLQNYIVSFWRMENRQDRVFDYVIIPDGSVDLLSGLYGDRELRVSVSQPGKMVLPLPPFSSVWGVRFYPSVFTSIFRTPMPEIGDALWLDIREFDTSPEARFLSEQLNENDDLQHKKDVFERFLNQYLLKNAFKTDDRFLNALQAVYQTNGHLRTEKDLNVGLCARQLRRVFDQYLGFSPKDFSKIVQLQHAVQRIHRPDYSYFDSGFYDQAHFIREIKAFTGLNPLKLKKALL